MDELEVTMAIEHLPRVRELSGLTAHMVMLRTVGALLRVEYNNLLQEPLPERLAPFIRRLP